MRGTPVEILTEAVDTQHTAVLTWQECKQILDRLADPAATQIALTIVESEPFMWLMQGDGDWTRSHIAAIQPAYRAFRRARDTAGEADG